MVHTPSLRSGRVRRAALTLAATAALIALPLVAPISAVATSTPALNGTGVVTLIHAVPGLIADVSVDGKVGSDRLHRLAGHRSGYSECW